MCGIAAVRSATGTGAAWLHTVLAQIEHRGLAGTRYETAPQDASGWTLGTHRLPIVAPAVARQPAWSPARRYLVAFNGEVFNHPELAGVLGARGSTPNVPASDTSVLAAAIEHWGPVAAVGHLVWEGAFLCLDTTTGELWAGRDHLGIKPLYRAEFANGTAFASEVKALVGLPGCTRVAPVAPGTVQTNNATVGLVAEHTWWSPGHSPGPADPGPTDPDAAATEVLDLLRRSVHLRVPREGRYAIALSGGLDSSLILRLAVETGRVPDAYVLHGPGSTDLPYARNLCERLGVPLVEVPADSAAGLRGALPNTIRSLETWEWHVVNHAAPMDRLAAAIHADGHRVALSGEGADELFLGYDRTSSADAPEVEQRRRTTGLHRTNCRRLDRMGMAHQVEFRVPFLDRALTDRALSLHSGLLVRDGVSKPILRRAAAEVLPADFVQRGKLSLARGVGYDYAPGDHPTVFGSLDQAAALATLPATFGTLARYPAERVFLRHFLDNSYDKADYLLERTV